ncbi:MAG: SBBP repeat-containing protein [Bacteroidetes bacterium]|nr:SBBP repeat-containing protein [Bacteroidota bacterium]
MKYLILIILFFGFVSGKEIQAQNLAWSKTINLSYQNYTEGVGTDTLGNVFVAGE